MPYLSWLFGEESWPDPESNDQNFAKNLKFPTEAVPVCLALQVTATREDKDAEGLELVDMEVDDDFMKSGYPQYNELDEHTVEDLKAQLTEVDPQDEFLTAFRTYGTKSLSKRIVTRQTHPNDTEEELIKRQRLEDQKLQHDILRWRVAEKIYKFEKEAEEDADVIRELEEDFEEL